MRIYPRCCAVLALCSSLTAIAGAEEWRLFPTAATQEDAALATTEEQPYFASGDETYWGEEDSSQLWTFWAGAIFLDRSNPRDQSLVRSGGVDLINARNLDFVTQGGIDINALRHGEYFDVDFRYFQVNNMGAHDRIFPTGGVDLPFANPVSFPTPQLDAFYKTSIQSVEINLRKNYSPRLAFLAGFRYLALDDDLSHQFDITGDSFSLYKYQHRWD